MRRLFRLVRERRRDGGRQELGIRHLLVFTYAMRAVVLDRKKEKTEGKSLSFAHLRVS